MACGVTNTLYSNQIAPAVMKEYGGALKGGCPCMAGAKQAPKQPPPKMAGGGGEGGLDGLGGTCSGTAPMLKALGIMRGGATHKQRQRQQQRQRQRQRQRQSGGTCTTCRMYRGGKRSSRACSPGTYKPTAADKTRLRRHLAGKSIGFTQRSSLKAKGLLRRANGTCKVSKKYQ